LAGEYTSPGSRRKGKFNRGWFWFHHFFVPSGPSSLVSEGFVPIQGWRVSGNGSFLELGKLVSGLSRYVWNTGSPLSFSEAVK